MKCDKCGTEISNPGISFCPKCGKYLKKVNNEDKKVGGIVKIEESKNNKKKIGLIVSGIFILVIILLVIIIVPKSNNEEYFFSGVDEEVIVEESGVETPTTPSKPVEQPKPTPVEPPKTNPFDKLIGVSKSGYSGKPKNNTQTKIIHDRQYFKQITVKDKDEVLSLVKYDSEKQKTGCNTNIIAVENSISSNYGITAVNLCEMDYDFALELKNVVSFINSSFPSSKSYMTNLTLANVENASYIASFMPIFTFITASNGSNYPVGIKTQILLNSKYFLNISKINSSVNYGANTGYFPPNATRSSTVAHEFGHYLSYIALLKHYNVSQLTYVPSNQSSIMYKVYEDFNAGNYSKSLLEEAYRSYCKDTGTNVGFDNFRASISKYAMSKDSSGNYIYDETIAEAFHDVYLNSNTAKVASRYIYATLKSKI